ncbi:MAG: ABC transporter substrate-binding protein [Actinomycetota bacterium]|nr:ABC transporter substrate-binding protein [Actinomycetota bacterium]
MLFAAACGAQPTVQTGKDRILIGAIVGSDAAVGTSVTRGIQVALREYNEKKDSIFEAELRQFDSKGTPEGAKQAADALVKTDHVVGVIGPLSGAEVVSAAGSFEPAQMPFLVPSVSSNSIPQPGWKGFRRMIANDSREGQLLGTLAYRRTDGPIDIFNDGQAGAPIADAAKAVLEGKKRTVTRAEVLPAKLDLKAFSAGVMSAAPAGIIYCGAAKKGLDVVASLRKAGYKGPLFMSHEARATPADKALTGLISDQPQADPADQAVADFSATFQERFTVAPTPYAVEAYEAALMLLEAVQEVAPKPDDVSSFFRLNPSFLGDSKSYDYSESGEVPKAPVWVYESQNGAWRLTGSFSG